MMDTLGPAIFGIILLLYRGCPLQEVRLHCHGTVGTTKFVLYREVKCIVFYSECLYEQGVHSHLLNYPRH